MVEDERPVFPTAPRVG